MEGLESCQREDVRALSHDMDENLCVPQGGNELLLEYNKKCDVWGNCNVCDNITYRKHN